MSKDNRKGPQMFSPDNREFKSGSMISTDEDNALTIGGTL